MKSRISIQIYFFLSLFLLSCTDKQQNSIRLSGWISSTKEEKLLQQLVAEFEKKYPEIKIEYEPIPGNYMDKIQLMLATKTAPDVFYLDAFYAPALISYDVLEPLDQYIGNDSVNIEDFEPSLLNAFQSGGKTYGLVKDYTTVGLFYNTEIFKKEGISRPPATWNEFKQILKQLKRDTDGDGKIDQWGFCIQPSLEYLLPFVYQNDGSFFNSNKTGLAITEPAFMSALDFYVNLYKEGYAIQPSDIGSAWPGDAFGKGNIGTICSGNFAIPFLNSNYPQIKYAIAPLPKNKKEATLAFIVGYVIPKSCKKKEQAWQLLNYLTGVEGMTKWTSLGLALPPRKSVVAINQFDKDTLKHALVESARFAKPWQLSEHYRIFDETQTALQKMFLTDIKCHEVMKELTETLNSMLYKKKQRDIEN